MVCPCGACLDDDPHTCLKFRSPPPELMMDENDMLDDVCCCSCHDEYYELYLEDDSD